MLDRALERSDKDNAEVGRVFMGLWRYVRCALLRAVSVALCALIVPIAATAAKLDLKYVTVDGKPIDGAVVVLRDATPGAAAAKPVVATMDQVNRSFVPHVLVVPTGSSVAFANSDVVSHQVYSFSLTKKFQLPLFKGKAPAPVVFDRSGVVAVGCNIHDQMSAFVFVVDAQFYGRTDKAGTWGVADLPAGAYQLKVWHPRARDMRPLVEQIVTVSSNGSSITLREPQALKLRPVAQVPANWDAY
jgi:plastocyanin